MIKLRLFYKPVITDMKTATGKVEIRNGSADFVLRTLKTELEKCQKVIIEQR